MSKGKVPTQNLGRTVGDVVMNLIHMFADKNPEGSGQNGRYAQYNEAERTAWNAAYEYGLDTDQGKAFGQAAGIIADEYHSCKWLIAGAPAAA